MRDAMHLARFPFNREALDVISGADIREFFSHEVISEAVRRIREAARGKKYMRGAKHFASAGGANYPMDIVTFAAAAIILKDAAAQWITGKWVLNEAKETERRITRAFVEGKGPATVSDAFDIGITMDGGCVVSVADYVDMAAGISGGTWDLVNQDVSGGMVRITQRTLSRLSRERAARMIRKVVDGVTVPDVQAVHEAAAGIRERYGNVGNHAAPCGRWPPCVADAIGMMERGENLSHSGRFMVGAFMLKSGADLDGIVSCFRGAPDFSERITRYQLKSIGGREYSCPSCGTLEAQGLCRRTDECGNIRNPMQYEGRHYGAGTPAAGPGTAAEINKGNEP